ncbi:response regulator [candidate division KSB1 bacterium]|nr:response regulator [candidate division KSB1 bacterium]
MRVLIIDSNKNDLFVNTDLIKTYGHTVDGTLKVYDGQGFIEQNHYDVILIENNLPHDGAFELLQFIEQKRPGCAVYILTEGISVARAVKAIKMKAMDVIFKPLDKEKLAKLNLIDQ